MISVVLLLFFVATLVFAIPKLLFRLGLSKWWAILGIFPIINIIAIWFLAYAKWPKMQEPSNHNSASSQ